MNATNSANKTKRKICFNDDYETQMLNTYELQEQEETKTGKTNKRRPNFFVVVIIYHLLLFETLTSQTTTTTTNDDDDKHANTTVNTVFGLFIFWGKQNRRISTNKNGRPENCTIQRPS